MNAFPLLALALVAADSTPPRVLDDRLELVLFAEAPQVTTPTGLVVDARGRVLVVENNTHFRPKEYGRAPLDRILALQDRDGDGRADQIDVFAEGLKHTMNLGLHPDGSLFVATRSALLRYRDRDANGVADGPGETLVRLETKGDYPHNGLSGFAFDFAGNVYFGFGENLGVEYRLIGSDGGALSGIDAGNVYVCGPDGAELRQIARGFWNPFHLCFDAFGRLFVVDNDPDSRPPCRLLHVAEGGDYGFRFRNGRKGVHPFTAWNGELPGTLPMASGTGEAPSGMLAYESDHLPAEYRGDLLVTSWGDHRLERYRLEPRGASFTARMTPVVAGDQNFRPVAIALAPDGSLYFSDWVDKSYQLHGQGRVWRLRAKNPLLRTEPANDQEALSHLHRPLREAAARRLDPAVLEAVQKTSRDERVRALGRPPQLAPGAWGVSDAPAALAAARELARQPDPFRLSALVQEVAALPLATCDELLASGDAEAALVAALALKQRGAGEEYVLRLLEHEDARVRTVAALWAGDQRITAAQRPLEAQLARAGTTRQLFEVTVAALDRISRPTAGENPSTFYILRTLGSETAPPALRAIALRALPPQAPELKRELLAPLLGHSSPLLRLEAIRTWRERNEPDRDEQLAAIALDAQRPAAERAEALLGLPADEPAGRDRLLKLAETAPSLAADAVRALAGAKLTDAERQRLEKLSSKSPALADAVAATLSAGLAPGAPAKDDLAAWLRRADGPGDAAAGERLFFHPRLASCYKCHESQGRGGRIGPDLTHVARSLTRERLIESLVQPSKEIAPQFTPWLILKDDGATLTGVYVGEEVDGTQRFADSAGQVHRVHPRNIDEKQPSRESIMPAGLVERLTAQELRDLLAFLTGRSR